MSMNLPLQPELESLLLNARREGKARPELIDQFNEQLEEQKK
jgi:hypothetical protein